MQNSVNNLLNILLMTDTLIGYEPMKDEPDFRPYLLKEKLPPPDFSVPASKDIPPEEIERAFKEKYAGKRVALFIPGRRFDVAGTRHGRGRGWYDRLLSKLPAEWVRIGVAAPDLVSESLLERKPWDEPVDFLLIAEESGYRIVETAARPRRAAVVKS